jgi:UDP-N-acetylglucosamine 2-epimerase
MMITAHRATNARKMKPAPGTSEKNNIQEKKEKNPIIIPHTTAVAINDFVMGILLMRYKMNMRILKFLLSIC